MMPLTMAEMGQEMSIKKINGRDSHSFGRRYGEENNDLRGIYQNEDFK